MKVFQAFINQNHKEVWKYKFTLIFPSAGIGTGRVKSIKYLQEVSRKLKLQNYLILITIIKIYYTTYKNLKLTISNYNENLLKINTGAYRENLKIQF